MTAWIETVETDINGTRFTAETFLGALRGSNSDWWDSSGELAWVFRGHSVASWRLIPSARRQNDERLDKDFRALLDLFLAHEPNRVRAQYMAEYTVIREFAVRADHLGFSIPTLPARDPLSELSSGLTDYTSHEQFEPEHRALTGLAQHHGVPTAMLDWTDQPLVAAYFACEGSAQRRGPGALCVWAWQIDLGNSLQDEIKAHRDLASYFWFDPPRSGSFYQRAQGGMFLHQAGGEERYTRTGRWLSLR